MSTEESQSVEETSPADGGHELGFDLSAEPEDPLLGKVVANRYKVLKKMGEGGMGTVYLAEHVTIEKKVALKVLLHEYARKVDLKERFLREAKAAASIGHENIIDITDFGETPDRSVFFAMEFLDGCDLSHAIKRDGPLPWSRAKPILLQICRSLGAAHSKDIIHRDMKPENVFLIDREGRPDFVKVLDFGIAKVSGASDGEHKLTRTGMIFGTPEYMSPEQAQGHQPDHRVDIYAVGVIMYELLTGQVPFKADTFMGILTKHIFENPVPPTQLDANLEIPVDAEAIVLKAMAKDRDERFSSMSEMAAAIKAVSGRMTRSTADLASDPIISGPDVTATQDRAAAAREAAKTVGAKAISAAPGGRVVQPVGNVESVEAVADVAVPQSRGKLIGLLLGLGVLAGAGIAAAVVLGGGGGETSEGPGSGTAALKPVEKISLLLISEPGGAEVFRGTNRVGVTPLTYRLPKSDNQVLFTFKYKGRKTIRVAATPDKEGRRVKAVFEAEAKPGTAEGTAAGATPVAVKPKPKVDATRKPTRKPTRRPIRRPGHKIRWPKVTKPTKPKPQTTPKPKPTKPRPRPTPTKVDRTDLKDPFAKKK